MALQRVLLLFMACTIFAVATHANIAIKDSTQRSNVQQQQRNTNLFAKDTQHREPTYQPIFIEVLQQRYFLLEDAMWNVIVSGLEQSYVLQQIYDGHRTFFLGNFTVHNCYLSTFDPHQSVIYDAMNAINRSAVDTIEKYLQTSAFTFSERDALALSVRNQNLTYQLDVLFDKMVNTDFLTVVRNVSSFIVLFRFYFVICRFVEATQKFKKKKDGRNPLTSEFLCLPVFESEREFVIHGHRFDNIGREGIKSKH